MIKYRCSKCGAKIGADDRDAGRVVGCPECDNKERVPDGDDSEIPQRSQNRTPMIAMAVGALVAVVIGVVLLVKNGNGGVSVPDAPYAKEIVRMMGSGAPGKFTIIDWRERDYPGTKVVKNPDENVMLIKPVPSNDPTVKVVQIVAKSEVAGTTMYGIGGYIVGKVGTVRHIGTDAGLMWIQSPPNPPPDIDSFRWPE